MQDVEDFSTSGDTNNTEVGSGRIMAQLTLLIFVSIALIFTTTIQTAASTSIASLDSMQMNPTPTPTPPFPFSTPAPTPTPTIPITLQPDINTLFKTLMTQELSSVDRVVLTTELERILDELAEGQSQISVEYEDDNEEEKTITMIITPVGLTALIEETEGESGPEETEETGEEEEEDNEDDNENGNGNDNGKGNGKDK